MILTKKFLDAYFSKLKDENTNYKCLRVFDFDNTLVKTDSVVTVHTANATIKLTSSEFSIYNKQPTDVFVFDEFDKLINPIAITPIVEIMKAVYYKHGINGLMILSARSSAEPIKQFLKLINFDVPIDIVAVGDANPVLKAECIHNRILTDKLEYLEFFDDSYRNIKAVKNLRSLHVDTKIVTRYIKHT